MNVVFSAGLMGVGGKAGTNYWGSVVPRAPQDPAMLHMSLPDEKVCSWSTLAGGTLLVALVFVFNFGRSLLNLLISNRKGNCCGC